MEEHKLLKLSKIIKDEIGSLQWTARIIRWILIRAGSGRQQLGVTKMRLESQDTKKFENMLREKIQDLEIELEVSNTAKVKGVLVNEIDTLRCVLDHLNNIKSGNDEAQAIGIARINNNNCRQVA